MEDKKQTEVAVQEEKKPVEHKMVCSPSRGQ